LLVLEVMRQESSFHARARSGKNAGGLMQMIPSTARRFGITDPYDRHQAVAGGCRYLRFLWDMFGGRVDLVLAGYNAGEHRVVQYGYQVPPYEETRNYVRTIILAYRRALMVEERERRKGGGHGLKATPVDVYLKERRERSAQAERSGRGNKTSPVKPEDVKLDTGLPTMGRTRGRN